MHACHVRVHGLLRERLVASWFTCQGVPYDLLRQPGSQSSSLMRAFLSRKRLLALAHGHSSLKNSHAKHPTHSGRADAAAHGSRAKNTFVE